VGNRVSNGIGNGGVGGYGTTLADAFDAEGVERRGRFDVADLDVRKVKAGRHWVVEQARGQQLGFLPHWD